MQCMGVEIKANALTMDSKTAPARKWLSRPLHAGMVGRQRNMACVLEVVSYMRDKSNNLQ